MAQKTRAQLIADITASITTNSSGDITGAILNALLDDIADSFLNKKDEVRSEPNKAVLAVGTAIVFAEALPNANYALTIRCFDGVGNPVAVAITAKLATGFTATPAINSTLDYIAIIN